ncbi:MAG: hypothetical protein IJV85_00365, partial [Clostridia bacterium]|nr:hypothetical protein [Clostridia bacterium]
MKKLTKVLLAALLTFCTTLGLAACNFLPGFGTSSSSEAQTSSSVESSSKEESSKADESSKDEESSQAPADSSQAPADSSDEPADSSQAPADSSDEPADDSSEEDPEPVPSFYSKEYYLEQDDGTYKLEGLPDTIFEHHKDVPVLVGDEVYCDQRLFYGYIFDETNENNLIQAVVDKEEGITLRRYYKKVQPTVEPTDSAAWGTVSEESLYAYARYYINGADHSTGHGTKIAYVLDEDSTLGQNMQSLKMVELSEENPVGDRTEGSYYMLDIYNEELNQQTHQFVLLPMYDMETYQANWADNAVLKFDVYFTYDGYDPEDPNCDQQRTFYTNGSYARTENVNTWYTLEVPLANLYENWDEIFDHPADQDYNGTIMSLFSLKSYVGTEVPENVPKPTFWIGNFSIEEPSYEETEWVWNKISANKNGAAFVCNGQLQGDWGTITYLESFAGANDVYKVESTYNNNQFNGILVTSIHDKEYYQNILDNDPNATVNVDMYRTEEETVGCNVLQPNGTWAISMVEAGKWNTIKIPLQHLVNNWDKLGQGGSYDAGTLLSIGRDPVTTEENYSFYVSNIKIETTYAHPNAGEEPPV